MKVAYIYKTDAVLTVMETAYFNYRIKCSFGYNESKALPANIKNPEVLAMTNGVYIFKIERNWFLAIIRAVYF